MGVGIHAELAIRNPGGCTVASLEPLADGPITAIKRTTVPGPDGQVSQEFRTTFERTPNRVTEVFSADRESVYRTAVESDCDCVCDCLSRLDCPVSNVRVEDGTLYLGFHARDLDEVRSILTKLRSKFTGVRVRRLSRRPTDVGRSNLVYVDRSRLTECQRAALEAAHDLGYFDHPKRANATEVAAEIGISRATFLQHLAAAQSKLLAMVLDH